MLLGNKLLCGDVGAGAHVSALALALPAPLSSPTFIITVFVLLLLLIAALMALGVRFIPNDRVGIVEKLWSLKGSLDEGRIMAFNGEAGYESKLLRGGIHFFKWLGQYRVHKVPLVTIPQGKIGYVYARDGEPLAPTQTLARVIACDNFQNADFDARGMNGQVVSDLPNVEIDKNKRGRYSARIGSGGAGITAKGINGNVRFTRG